MVGFVLPEREAADLQILFESHFVLLELGAAEALDVVESALEGTLGSTEIALKFGIEPVMFLGPERAIRLLFVNGVLRGREGILRTNLLPLGFGRDENEGKRDRIIRLIGLDPTRFERFPFIGVFIRQ